MVNFSNMYLNFSLKKTYISIKKFLKIHYIFYLFIFFFSAEYSLRYFGLGYNVQPINESSFNHHEHPKNFKFRSYEPNGEWGNFTINFDMYGNRIIKNICIKENSEYSSRIILLGDSFIEGIQVSDQDSIGGLLQKEYCEENYKVINLGVTSYSPVLSYIQLFNQIQNNKDLILENSTLIHFLSGNDLEDDNYYSKKIETINKGETVYTVINSKKHDQLLKILSRKSYFVRLIRRIILTIKVNTSNIFHDKEFQSKNNLFNSFDRCIVNSTQIQITKAYINKISKLVTNNGGKYIITAIPHDPQKREITNYLCFKEIAKELNIKFIESPNGFFINPSNYYFEKDLHLNIEGNKLLSNEIIRYLEK